MATKRNGKQKTIEETYQKMSQREHILLRPDTYVGSTEKQTESMFVWDQATKKIVSREIRYVPALYKIFDEIVVNAADNAMRDPQGMKILEITVRKTDGSISVMNDGQGVPVVIHKEHNMYVPELIFGHLLTSDNYDDSQKKVTGGRNGYGAKLTNVFSTKFIVECGDSNHRLKFTQVFSDNMSQRDEPLIEPYEGADFTRVTFWPDLKIFGMKKIEDDIFSLMAKRAYDIAGTKRAEYRVKFNKAWVPVSSFLDYVGLYEHKLDMGAKSKDEKASASFVHAKINNRWEVAFGLSEDGFGQVSHVNSICTSKGGTHVTHVQEQLVTAITRALKEQNKDGLDISKTHIQGHLRIFCNCLIENPAFDTQTKERLTTKSEAFGSTCKLPKDLVSKFLQSGVVEMVLRYAQAKNMAKLGKMLAPKGNKRKLMGIPKLEDARHAGTKSGKDCTLILTEGDSAKALAVAGLSVVGRDWYGVYPLKGKILNVRMASVKQVTKNAQIQELLKIMGLDVRKQYKDANSLRYGAIMIMADQDHDGSHIKGLLINVLHTWWPSLLKVEGFLKEFVTPIVKVTQGGVVTSFFTQQEYKDWQRKCSGPFKSKYYKGLGTSTAAEGKEYFRNLDEHVLSFTWGGKADDDAIDMAFSPDRADDRKEWMNAYEEGNIVDHSQKMLSLGDFVNKELIQFSRYDLSRSVPSIVDGLKTSQRKVLFACFKRNLKSDVKVAQLVGYTSEQTAYHHGETSLENTIINLAQDFVGSNNLNLLVPSGQFGTRMLGGEDHAASRYIYTRLAQCARLAFHPDDDRVLKYLDEDGQSVEPEWYCPVIPMVLVNGGFGIGTGWACKVPNFNPREIIANIRAHLRGEDMVDMKPWYEGFAGTIEEDTPGKYISYGRIEEIDATTLRITELPIKTWTQKYKDMLDKYAQDGFIQAYSEAHTANHVRFDLSLSRKQIEKAKEKGLVNFFKLTSSVPTNLIYLFDADGRIVKYDNVLEIMEEFCAVRRAFYVKRKTNLMRELTYEESVLSNKVCFIQMVVDGELSLSRNRSDILDELRTHGLQAMTELKAVLELREEANDDDLPADNAAVDVVGEDDGVGELADYSYLLNMRLWNLTAEKVEALVQERDEKRRELDKLKVTTVEQLWERDLEALERVLPGVAVEAPISEVTRSASSSSSSTSSRMPTTPSRTVRADSLTSAASPVKSSAAAAANGTVEDAPKKKRGRRPRETPRVPKPRGRRRKSDVSEALGVEAPSNVEEVEIPRGTWNGAMQNPSNGLAAGREQSRYDSDTEDIPAGDVAPAMASRDWPPPPPSRPPPPPMRRRSLFAKPPAMPRSKARETARIRAVSAQVAGAGPGNCRPLSPGDVGGRLCGVAALDVARLHTRREIRRSTRMVVAPTVAPAPHRLSRLLRVAALLAGAGLARLAPGAWRAAASPRGGFESSPVSPAPGLGSTAVELLSPRFGMVAAPRAPGPLLAVR
mmetsp:Transcript_37329/g.93759  ORF Transcript_37329/g.93759 Transcript_37329/m.93759 type:complete len:1470 (+) Transcript_37329:226-4635(+)